MARSLVDAREFGQMAKDLRRADKAVRDQVKKESRTRIAEPLAGKIRAAASGPHQRVLSAGTKTRAGSGAESRIVVGGLSPKLSGGGGPRHVVFGNEWGGGKRISYVAGHRRRGVRVREHRRYTTNQFPGKRPFVFPTAARNLDAIAEAYADIVVEALLGEVG